MMRIALQCKHIAMALAILFCSLVYWPRYRPECPSPALSIHDRLRGMADFSRHGFATTPPGSPPTRIIAPIRGRQVDVGCQDGPVHAREAVGNARTVDRFALTERERVAIRPVHHIWVCRRARRRSGGRPPSIQTDGNIIRTCSANPNLADDRFLTPACYPLGLSGSTSILAPPRLATELHPTYSGAYDVHGCPSACGGSISSLVPLPAALRQIARPASGSQGAQCLAFRSAPKTDEEMRRAVLDHPAGGEGYADDRGRD
jgi:hypothetical protein